MNEWLLDTGVLLWWLAADPRLSIIVRTRITQATTRVFVSVATAWEVASLARQGRVDLGEPPEICLPRQIALHRFLWLPLDARHVMRASALPRGTLDPYDRLLVAQAALEGLSIVTTDLRLGAHGVPVVEALERREVLEHLASMRRRRSFGRPCPRPVRRSGDELEGEAHADPTELRRFDNPAGAIDGGEVNAGAMGLRRFDRPAGTIDGREGRVGERAAAGAGEPVEAELGERPGAERGAVAAAEFGGIAAVERGESAGAELGGLAEAGPGGVAGEEPGGFAGEEPGGISDPDPVILRPVPRWNAFPWGGLSRDADADQ